MQKVRRIQKKMWIDFAQEILNFYQYGVVENKIVVKPDRWWYNYSRLGREQKNISEL